MNEQEIAELRKAERRNFRMKLIYVIVGLISIYLLATGLPR